MPIPHLKPKEPGLEPKFTVKKIGQGYRSYTQRLKSKTLKQKLISFWLPVCIIIIIVFILIGIGVIAWYSRDLPDPNKVIERNVAESTKIYANDGKTLLYQIHGEQNRTVVNLEDISNYVKWATIAVEDKNFYTHPGFSFKRIIKSLWVDIIQGKKSQGASTITQQFIKNAILTTEKKWSRKIKEVVLAYQIERKFTKDQILKMYFNEIPYGSTAYGIESAAQTFFGKSAKDLNLAESSLLAALPQAPSYYSPYGNHTDELSIRKHFVLDQMVKQGYITKAEAEEAKADNTLVRVKPKSDNILAPHFVMYVKEILSQKYGEKVAEQGGLKVITTLNIDKQKVAEEVVKKWAEKNEKNYKAKNAALVCLDAKTGQILAMVGSRDYFDTANDGNVNVALRPRQPGSSFKPVVYATAFLKGYTPETILFDLVTKFKTDTKDYEPHNYDSKEHGPISMRSALAGSLNIPAVKTLYLAGIDNVLDQAQKMGYTTFSDRSRFGLSLVLGGGEVTLLEHATAYSVFSREGIWHPTTAILKIEDKNGKVLEEFQNTEQKVLDQNVAQEINSILSDNNARAFIFGSKNYLTLPDRPVAAKTGTTNDYRDAWTIGYTPSYVTGVWVGNNDNSEMKRGADGSVVAAPIWNEFMKRTVGGPVETFHPPKPNSAKKPILQGKLENETKYKVDKYTEKIIPDSCLNTYPPEYITEKTFQEVHNILYYVDKDNPDGPVPDHPEKDPQYDRWEEPVQKWLAAKGVTEKKPPLEQCNLRSDVNKPKITFTAPTNDSTIQTNQITITATIESSKVVGYVEYFIDDISIGQVKQPPYTLNYTITDLENGFHELSAKVHDIIENIGVTSINFNYLISSNSPVTYITDPASSVTIPTTSFPYIIKAFAYDPAGISKIDFYYSQDGQPSLIDTITSPTNENITLTWSTAPPAGTYKVYFIITNISGTTTQSDYVSIIIS